MRALLTRVVGIFDKACRWLGFEERKLLTTNPPPMVHKQPRFAQAWHEPGKVRRPVPLPRDSAMPIIPIELDEDRTPTDAELKAEKRPTLTGFRHARKRPPKHQR